MEPLRLGPIGETTQSGRRTALRPLTSRCSAAMCFSQQGGADCSGAWRLPERRLIAEAGLGAPIISVCPVDEHAVLVGTDSGLALVHIAAEG